MRRGQGNGGKKKIGQRGAKKKTTHHPKNPPPRRRRDNGRLPSDPVLMIDPQRYPRLSRIAVPADLRKFPEEELPAIAAELRGQVFVGDFVYPQYRLFIIGSTLIIGIMLFIIQKHSKVGAIVRAGVDNREMASAVGINIVVRQSTSAETDSFPPTDAAYILRSSSQPGRNGCSTRTVFSFRSRFLTTKTVSSVARRRAMRIGTPSARRTTTP